MSEHRSNVHRAWLAVVLAGGVASFYLGSHVVGHTLTQLAWQNQRGGHFGNIRAALRLLSQNDLTAYHAFSRAQLHDAIAHLAVEDDEWHCSENQGRTLSHAQAWLADHPDRGETYVALQPLTERGLRACEKP